MPGSRVLVAPLPLLALMVALGIEGLVGARRGVGWLVVVLLTVPAAVVTALYTLLPVLGYDLALDVQRTGYPGQLWAYATEHWAVDVGSVWPSLVHPEGRSGVLVAVWLGVGVVFFVAGLRRPPAGAAH